MGRQHQKAAERSPQARARRKPAEEWEKWHDKLVHLYQEEHQPRKDIIETMRREHNFRITDRQLKYHFQTCNITKHVSNIDMGIMLTLKEENEAVGKMVKFKYKGHDISPSRLERAQHKWKGPLPSPQEVPPYVKVLTVPSAIRPNAKETLLGDWNEQHNGKRSPNSSPQIADLYKDGQQSGHEIDDSKIPYIDWSLQDISSFDTVGSHFSLPSSETVEPTIPDVFRFSETPPYSDDAQAIRLTPSMDGFELMQPLNSLYSNDSSSQESEGARVCKVDLDWSKFLDLSTPRLPAFAVLDPGTEKSQGAELHHGTYHDHNVLTSPGLPQKSLGNGHTPQGAPFLPKSNDHTKYRKRISLGDTNAEDVIWPLQLMKSHLQMSSDNSKLQWHRSCGSTIHDLHSLINSRWLLLELEDLLCWSYESSLKASLRRKTSRGKGSLSYSSEGLMENAFEAPEETNTCEQIVRQDPGQVEKRTKFTSYWLSLVPMGALSIRLKTVNGGHSAVRGSHTPWILSIQSMPKATGRTKGVSAKFVSPTGNCDGPRISPYITTFNLVPEDSLVIQYISSNNIQGVKRLFESSEASPRDVDPWGFSLLSYAMYTGCSEVFCLLLKCGVGIQNCERFGNALDAIWAIWSYFVVFNSDDHNNKDLGGCLKDFDQCVAMTNMVLKHGCDIQDTVCYSAKANALFEICYYWPMDRTNPLIPAKALIYLISIGYELEQQNQEGQTPLLWTTSAYQPHVIKCLKVFIGQGANIHVTDGNGRGALHCALLVPHILDSWKSLGLINQDVHVSKFYYLPSHHYRTEDTAHAEDYVLERVDLIQQGRSGLPGGGQALTSRTQLFVEPQLLIKSTQINPQPVNETATNKAPLPDQDKIEYVMCRDLDGNEYRIQDPIKVLKTRLMFKLLTLLQAGCDPNFLDSAGLPPSHFAKRDGLWPQWIWACKNSGHEYDLENDLWIKAHQA